MSKGRFGQYSNCTKRQIWFRFGDKSGAKYKTIRITENKESVANSLPNKIVPDDRVENISDEMSEQKPLTKPDLFIDFHHKFMVLTFKIFIHLEFLNVY